MKETRKIPLQMREAELCALETRKDGPQRITFSLSSEHPVERGFGLEVLSHDKGAIRMDRLSRGTMPLLVNHDWDDPVGMVDSGELRDGKLSVNAHLFDTDRANEVRAWMEGGLRNVSVGYRIHDAVEDRKSGEFRVTDWEPYEASLVTVPADPTVGLGRADVQEFEVEVSIPATTAENHEVFIMSEQLTASAGASADVRNDSAALERLRIQTIHKLAEQHKIPSAEREAWVSDGVSVDDASRKVLDVLAERGSRNPETSVAAVGLSSKEAKQYSMFKAVRAVLDKNWGKAGLEFEAHKEIARRTNQNVNENTFYVPLEVQKRPIAQRDISVAASGGGYLVETSNQGFIELLRNRSVAFSMGATRLSGLVGNVNIPKQSAAATAYWLAAETTQITESQQTVVQVPLTPKTVGGYTEISRLLLLQSSPDAEALVMADLAAITAIAMDKAALHGAGGAGEPAGIVGASGVSGVTATTIGTGTYGKMLDFQLGLANANALFGNLGYVTTPTVAKLLTAYSRFANTDTPVWNGNLLNATVAGLPAVTSNQVAAAHMIFGNWADLIIGEWGVLAVEANPYANFQAGIIGVRAMYTVDIALRRGQSFAVSTEVSA